MSRSSIESKIVGLENKLRAENERGRDIPNSPFAMSRPGSFRKPTLGEFKSDGTPNRPRKVLDLPFSKPIPKPDPTETENKLKEIYKMQGKLKINGVQYLASQGDLEDLGELGNGTCGHVVKMLHKPSSSVIAVKQMRRSGNTDENKRIIMDLEVVLKSHDCPYIVRCLGCFITDADVWICMELMATCFDKLLKRLNQPVPEDILGKVTVATVNALSYLKVKHGVIHRDVKPSNILLDERGRIKLCDFGISGRLVDSKAKTRSAGCAAYMAPERIDLSLADYDIRADVWSLGITLVELATGQFPYLNCKNDFEVLSRVLAEDPPSLSEQGGFSPEFQDFVKGCLTKDYQRRPKYDELLKHPFVVLYSNRQVDVAEWYGRITTADNHPAAAVVQRRFGTPPASPKHVARRHFTFRNTPNDPKTQLRQYSDTLPKHNGGNTASLMYSVDPMRNGVANPSPLIKPNMATALNNLNRETPVIHYTSTTNYIPTGTEPAQMNLNKFGSPVVPRKYSTYHNSSPSNYDNVPVGNFISSGGDYNSRFSPNLPRNYNVSPSPAAYLNGSNIPTRILNSANGGSALHYQDAQGSGAEDRLRCGSAGSPFLPRRSYDQSPPVMLQQPTAAAAVATGELEGFWQVTHPLDSPNLNRKRIQAYPDSYQTQHSPRGSNTSPIVLERFYHQQKQRRSSRSPPVGRSNTLQLTPLSSPHHNSSAAHGVQDQQLTAATTTTDAQGAVKRRFASCIKVQLGNNSRQEALNAGAVGGGAPGGVAISSMLGNSSPVHGTRLVTSATSRVAMMPDQFDRRRHQSPDPPPRLNRDNPNSPLAMHRSYLERLSSSPQSPSLPRRFLGATPQPPPRRLSESSDTTPHHLLHGRLHYTPEPQRRPPHHHHHHQQHQHYRHSPSPHEL